MSDYRQTFLTCGSCGEKLLSRYDLLIRFENNAAFGPL